MPFDTTDAITEEAVRGTVEGYIQENLQFRQAFTRITAPEGADPWTFVNPADTMGEPDEIQPGAEYPAMEEDYNKITVDRRKFAGRVSIIDEAGMNNTFDVMAEQTDALGRQMAEKLNEEAYNYLSGHLNVDSPVGDNGGQLVYDEILTGKRHLREDGYNPDLLIIDPLAEEDLLTDADFTRDTEMGDNVVQSGELTRASGLDVVVSNTGDLGDHNAFVIDTDQYGYEVMWSNVETDTFRDEETDTDNIKTRVYANWLSINDGAAILVEG